MHKMILLSDTLIGPWASTVGAGKASLPSTKLLNLPAVSTAFRALSVYRRINFVGSIVKLLTWNWATQNAALTLEG